MSDLHDMAKDLGVEVCGPSIGRGLNESQHRPDLEIAHDMLAKLPVRPGLSGLAYSFNELAWCWYHYDGRQVEGTGTFIECVIALWKRQKAIP